MRIAIHPAFIAFLLFSTINFAQAQTPTSLGQYQDWAAFKITTTDGKLCYAVTMPKNTLPKGVNRDPVYFFVSNRPRQGIRNEVNVIIGYPFKNGHIATIIIDREKKFSMATAKNGAWINNAAKEGELIQALRSGKQMSMIGLSRRNTKTTDTYSLLGVSAALDTVNSECR